MRGGFPSGNPPFFIILFMSPLPERKRIHCFLLVASGVLLSTLDSSMINVALPSIAKGFQAGISAVDLVVLAYLMVISVSLVLWGRLADRFGKGRVYLTGMIVFGAGAAACGFSGNFYLLIVFRSIQACGAAMMMAAGPALIKFAYPRDQLGRTLGMIGVATSCGLMCGPAVSGFLLSHFSWRAVFFVPLPICLVVSVLAFIFLLPSLRKEDRSLFLFDWQGGIAWFLLVSAYVLLMKVALVSRTASLVMAVVVVVLLILFVFIEKRVKDPILPLSLVTKRFFWTAAAASVLSFCALFIVIILLPFYLDTILNFDAGKIGLTMMALPVSLVFFSPLSGRLYDRFGTARLISSIGLLVSAGAVYMFMQLSTDTEWLYIATCLALLGAGQSIFLSPNSASVLNNIEEQYAGMSAGILATARNFGMMSGAGIAGGGFSLLSVYFSKRVFLGENVAEQASYLLAQKAVFAVALTVLLSGVVISLSRR